MSLESAKRLGFISSILFLVSPVISFISIVLLYAALFGSIMTAMSGGISSFFSPAAGFVNVLFCMAIIVGVISFVGYVMFMVAMYRLSKYYSAPLIFKNLLKALIILIIWSVVVSFVSIILVSFFISTSIPTSGPLSFNFAPIFIILGLIGCAIPVAIFCGLLHKRSFDELGRHSGVEDFKTAGLLFFIGAILSFVGGNIITWISWIFVASGFNKLASKPVITSYNYSSMSGSTLRCPRCGGENKSDGVYCIWCGCKLSSC